jgi:aquaporin Z
VDAAFYSFFQFVGGAAGVALAAWVLPVVSHPTVRYVVTVPGEAGRMVALVAEAVISGGLMLGVLITSNHPRLTRFTGWAAGFLLLVYIAFEAPLSGMSINPARTVGSAAWANIWTGLWIYFAAPIGGMLIAAEAYVRWKGPRAVFCAKLNHHWAARCIFHCRFDELRTTARTGGSD